MTIVVTQFFLYFHDFSIYFDDIHFISRHITLRKMASTADDRELMFIELWRDNPSSYDVDSKSYSNKNEKRKPWKTWLETWI